jgi:cytochrome c biogenesis protein CcdA
MGSQLLTTGSVLAAFFAGGVALFAPCCIVFLAPSYLAGAVKNRRWRLLPLTFVFAAGLATVLLPITLGVSMVAGAIAKYHAPLYYAGGVLMLALAALALSGRFGLVAGGAYLLSGAICTLLALWLNRELAKERASAKA